MKTPINFPVLAAAVTLAFVLPHSLVAQSTFYNMTTGDYSQDFADIANWANSYASGIGANNWRVATSVTTSPGSNYTVFSTVATGGVQKGLASMIFLATGTNAGATDLLLNFSGRKAGNLSFNWSKIVNTANNANPRTSDLKVQFSLNNGATFTDLTGYTVPRISNNDTAQSGLISFQLPAALDNQAQVVIRFYFWNNGQTGGSGNRPKWDVDNVSVTSSPAVAGVPVITSALTASVVAYATSSNIYQIIADNSPTSFGADGLPAGLSLDAATGIISGTATIPGVYPVAITATNSQGTGGATLNLTVTKNPGAPTISSSLTSTGLLGSAYSYILWSSNPSGGSESRQRHRSYLGNPNGGRCIQCCHLGHQCPGQ